MINIARTHLVVLVIRERKLKQTNNLIILKQSPEVGSQKK